MQNHFSMGAINKATNTYEYPKKNAFVFYYMSLSLCPHCPAFFKVFSHEG